MSSYALEGPKWSSTNITWSFETSTYANNAALPFSDPISAAYQATIRAAFAAWASVSGLTFTEVPDGANYSQSADIRVGFGLLNTAATGTIGNTTYGSVGGGAGVQTFLPDTLVQLEDPSQSPIAAGPNGLAYQNYGSTLYQIALHEIGHALGMAHSASPTDVMYPSPGGSDLTLGAGDIAGIQALYGAPAAAPAEDAYLGDAQFSVAIDGQQIGGVQSVTALHAAGQAETFTFKGTFGAGTHTVAVSFLNDAYGGTAATDRNLYVDGVALDGTAAANGSATLFSNGTATFSVSGGTAAAAPTPTPPPVPPPAPPPVAPPSAGPLGLPLSEAAYLGDAQFVVNVDGQQVGGTQTATALHGAGQTQDFTIGGALGTGPHQVGVTFLNDLYAGTPTTDRNLYVDGASLNGSAVSGDSATLFSNGTAMLAVPGTAAAASRSLTFNLSEDDYAGDAQAIVSVDGVQLGGVQTITASHVLGASQALTFLTPLAAGAHTASVQFLNDAYAGTPSTDRNLYFDSLVVNGAQSNANIPLYSNGAVAFAFTVPAAAPAASGLLTLGQGATHTLVTPSP